MGFELKTFSPKVDHLTKAPPAWPLLNWVPALSESFYYLPLPHPVFLFWSSSSSLLCQTGWWIDRDSTGHRRWKPLLPECFSICSERQSGNNMHICLYIWNAHSLLYATVLKSFWWGMMRVSSLFTAISWRKNNFFLFFFTHPFISTPSNGIKNSFCSLLLNKKDIRGEKF